MGGLALTDVCVCDSEESFVSSISYGVMAIIVDCSCAESTALLTGTSQIVRVIISSQLLREARLSSSVPRFEP
jgi:hypothetical protein